MAAVIRDEPRRAARRAALHTSALVVSIEDEASSGAPTTDAPVARVAVSVRDEALARRLMGSVTRGVRAELATGPSAIAVVRVRSRKALDRVGARVTGAIVVVPVTARSVRRAAELVDALRALGAAGIQLAWQEDGPPCGPAEARVFAILEHVRATPGRAPVVFARGDEPAEALRILVDRRGAAATRQPRPKG